MEPIERAGRAEIVALQERLLREAVAHAWRDVPFYRQRWEAAGIVPGDIRTLTDFRKLPIIGKTDIDADLVAHPPFGSYQGPCVDQGRVARVHASSGTTGDPRPILCTLEDVHRVAKLSARRLRAQGVRPGDLLQVTLPYTLYIGGTIALEGAMELGAGVIPTGTGAMTHSRRQIEIAHRWRPTVLCATPSYALKLAETAAAMNLDPARDFAFRMIYVTAEVLTAELRREVAERWNAEVYDNYGSVEAAASTFECAAHAGWHVSEDAYIFETVDRATDLPVAAAPGGGEDGVLVITTLSREAAPFFRYKVGDIVSLDNAPCACGRTFQRMSTVKGRSDEMIKIRGISVYPTAIERVLRGFSELGLDWQLVVDRKLSAKDALVEVEALRGLTYAERTTLANRVADELKNITGILPEVEVFDLGTLFPNPDDRAKVKTKRIVERAGKPRSAPPLWTD